MIDSPLVSIVINNYNYGKYLKDSIDSALQQTYKNIEVIVVDDGSTDHSLEIIEEYKDKVTSILKKNGGQASAFNAGFKVCKGEIICLLDADDIFLPNKVATVVTEFLKNKECRWLIHKMNHINNEGELVEVSERKDKGDFLERSGDYTKQARYGAFTFVLPATSAIVFHRTLIEQVLPVPVELKITADNYLKFACMMLSPILVCNELLSSQRIHGNNLYTNKNRATREFRKQSRHIKYHIAKGINSLDIDQKQSTRLFLNLIKSSFKDRDVSMIFNSVMSLFKKGAGKAS